MTQNDPQIGGEVALFEAPDGQIRLDMRLELNDESNVQILHILRKSGYSGIHAGDQAAAWGLRATVAENATTAIHGFTGAVECLTRKTAETARERVL